VRRYGDEIVDLPEPSKSLLAHDVILPFGVQDPYLDGAFKLVLPPDFVPALDLEKARRDFFADPDLTHGIVLGE
jgi:hypothetical protein